MFFPPKQTTILTILLALMVLATASDAFAYQSAEFEKRAAAMRRARARGQQVEAAVQPATYADIDDTNYGVANTVPPAPVARIAQSIPNTAPQGSASRNAAPQGSANRNATSQGSASRNSVVVQNSRTGARRTVINGRRGVRDAGIPARSVRTAQLIHQDGAIIDGGAPIVGESFIDGQIVESYPAPVPGGFYEQGPIIDDGYGNDGIVEGGQIVDQCISCGETDGYFQGPAYGGYRPYGPLLLSNLARAFRNGEYFGGAVAFQSPLFTVPGQDAPEDENVLASDSSFGFYGGFNIGVPLYQLSGGLLSGQFGIRSVNTNFQGNEFTSEDRSQIFVTAGVYRRVDYGLQFGVVADVLHEEWFTETDLVQIRGDLSWVYPAGHVFGFRFATGVQDEETDGVFNGQEFEDFFQTTDDNFRLYYRHAAKAGGYGEAFIGWAETDQTVIGLELDLPLTERVALQSGFTAYLNDDEVPAGSNFQGGNLSEAWNLYVGVSFRPSGKAWYKSYDRPLFSVADNGSFVVRRQSPELTP